MTLFRNRYRIESTRLKHHDYAANGYYFVTICTDDRIRFFGRVVDGEMRLSAIPFRERFAIGGMAQQLWMGIPDHFSHVRIDEFVVMPDHVHGIIVIDRPTTHAPTVETRDLASLPHTSPPADRPNQFAPLKPGSLQTIVHSYKSSLTRWCRKNGHDDFRWQPRFHDRIIHDRTALSKVRAYIVNNPANWQK